MILADDPLSLSLLFHLNSEPWLNEDAYSAGSFHHEFKQFPDALVRVSLPVTPHEGLATLVRARRSERTFAAIEMPLSALAAVLSTAYGVAEVAPLETGGTFLRRTVPSGGGLYPLELFVFARRISGLGDGLYHYDVVGHALEMIPAGDNADILARCFYTYPFIEHANVVFCFAADFMRTQKKYGPRGYRYILLEAGHAAQNACLAATELGIATLCMGGFVDSALNAFLHLDPRQEGVVYAVAAGYSAT